MVAGDTRQGGLPDAVMDVVERFRQGAWGGYLLHPSAADGLCTRASLALIAQLEPTGCNPKLLRMPLGGTMHAVVAVDDTIIDFTRRQFVSDAPVPTIETRDELIAALNPTVEPTSFDPDWDLSAVHRGNPQSPLWIPANWRDLLRDADPPGVSPEWPPRS